MCEYLEEQKICENKITDLTLLGCCLDIYHIYRMYFQPIITITTVDPMDAIWRGVVTGSDVLIV